jgi:hypothetical protein
LCDALRREYAEVLAEHVKLQLERHMMAATNNTEREDELDGLIVVAEERRVSMRTALRAHEARAHTATAGGRKSAI